MAKLRVHRKSYIRKAYTRKDGTRVRASRVGGSTFRVKDRGKRGRTPKSQQWYHPQVETGWKKDMPMSTRRSKALRAHKGDALATARGLQALANTTTDQATKRSAHSDAQYFYAQHRKTGK